MNSDQLTNAWKLILDRLGQWYEVFFSNLPNVLVAVLVVVAFWLLARIVRNLANRAFGRLFRSGSIQKLFVTSLYLATLFMGVFIALGILKLDKTVTTLLAGAGIIGLALGFAFQDIAENLIAGIILAIRRPIDIGDLVKTNDQFGIVQSIHLRTTELRSLQGQEITIPNKMIFSNTLINYSKLGRRRIDLDVGISYGDDLEKVRRVTLAAVNAVDGVIEDQPVDFYYTGFGDSSINFQVRFWVMFSGQTDFLAAQSDAIMRIKKAYDENDITIPFPIRTLDFGAAGSGR